LQRGTQRRESRKLTEATIGPPGEAATEEPLWKSHYGKAITEKPSRKSHHRKNYHGIAIMEKSPLKRLQKGL